MAAKSKPKAKRNVMANIADLLRQKMAARNAPPARRPPMMMPQGGAPMPPDSMTPGGSALTQ